jgi:hypothetical protein
MAWRRASAGDMLGDLGLQARFVLVGPSPGRQPLVEAPEKSHFRSSALAAKNRAMMAAVCSQSRVSA